MTNRPLVDDALHQLPGQPVRSHHIVGNLGNGALAYQPLLAPKSLVLWFGEASGKPISLDFFCFFPGREGMTLRHFVYNQLDGADDGRSTT